MRLLFDSPPTIRPQSWWALRAIITSRRALFYLPWMPQQLYSVRVCKQAVVANAKLWQVRGWQFQQEYHTIWGQLALLRGSEDQIHSLLPNCNRKHIALVVLKQRCSPCVSSLITALALLHRARVCKLHYCQKLWGSCHHKVLFSAITQSKAKITISLRTSCDNCEPSMSVSPAIQMLGWFQARTPCGPVCCDCHDSSILHRETLSHSTVYSCDEEQTQDNTSQDLLDRNLWALSNSI